MKTDLTLANIVFSRKILALAAIVCLVPAAHASTFWNGPNISFTQGDNGPADVMVPGAVEINRGINLYLYNSAVEPGPGVNSPVDTTWAVGSPGMIGNLSAATVAGLNFIPFGGATPSVRTTAQGAPWFSINPYIMTGNGSGGPITFVVHLVQEDIYLTLTFTDWGQHFTGGFAYNRSTPSAVTPPPTPTISITSPADGTVLSAPANIKFTVDASVSSGSVSNVSFFNGSSVLGSSQTPPFNFTSGALGAGSYQLTAVATAAGISATSSVVNVSVVTPVTTSLSAPAAAANNQFSFSYSANSGLRYVVESSSNLVNWTPLATNVANGSSGSFVTNVESGDAFFRVGRMPNP